MPNLYILAGPNGAGKTTAAYTLLPEVLEILEFVNADEIARGLSPFNAEAVSFEAGRIMLQRIDFLIGKGTDFAFETTLSTRSYVQTIRRAKQAAYTINLFYFWLPSADVAKERVVMRMSQGGHGIPPDIIERRYKRSLLNLIKLYIPICDYFVIFNNAEVIPEMVASGGMEQHKEEVFNQSVWEAILNYEQQSGKGETY